MGVSGGALWPADLEDLAASEYGSRLYFVAEIGSTNDAAIGLALAGAPEGLTVLADAQHAGRGRRGRSWVSPPGAGIYLSMIRRPPTRDEWSLMTLAAGVAAAQAIAAATALPIELKWPNDLVIGRPWRKVGGVLCESVSVGPGRDAIIVGIGINARTAALPAELVHRATSLEAELGRPVDRAPVVLHLMAALDEVLGQLRRGERAWIRRAWRNFGRAGFEDGAIRWHDQERLRTGMARDIDEDGALIVEAGGRTEMIRSGEVTWERLSRE